MKEDIILESALGLHNWRVKYNGDDVGMGLDKYKPNELFRYPEAYALWGSGYINLYKSTKENRFLEAAKGCALWLKNNKSPAYKDYSWGLPWEWESWGAPKETSYASTTGFVGDFFFSLYKEDKASEYLDILKSMLNWLNEENSGISYGEEGMMFYYSPFPKLKFSIYNATAKAGGLFAKVSTITNEKDHKAVALGCAKYLIKHQNPDGSWFYSERNRNIDNYHTAFVLESLSEIYEVIPASIEIRDSLQKGLRYYLKNFYYPNGRGEELSISAHKAKTFAPLFIRRIWGILPIHNDETTLFSYGSGIRALSKASKILDLKNDRRKIALYALEHLKRSDGAFKHKISVSTPFIRDEGHIFDGLCNLLIGS